MRVLAALVLVLATACTSVPPSFTCTTDTQCRGGRCELAHVCSLPDPVCMSQWRYDESAGALGGTCVGGPGVDGGGDAASGPGGASRCDQLGAADQLITCSGFEGTSNGLSLFSMNGTTSFDSTRAYRGGSSLHLEVAAGLQGQRKFAEVQALSLPTQPMYATRAFFYFPDTPIPQGTALVGYQQPGPTTFRSDELSLDGAGRLVRNHSPVGGVGSTASATSTTTMPRGRWVCVELRATWDASAGRVRVLLDDVPMSELDYDGPTLDDPQRRAGVFGMFFDPASAASYEMWVDELVIAAAPIGCAK